MFYFLQCGTNKKSDINLGEVTPLQLDYNLQQFYADVHKKEGENHS